MSPFYESIFQYFKAFAAEYWKVLDFRSNAPANLFQPSVSFHIETNHLVYNANQMIGFYMKCNAGLKRVKGKFCYEID